MYRTMPVATHDTITMKELVRCSTHRNVTKAISAHLGAKPQCMMTLVIVLLPVVQFRVMNQSVKGQSHASKNGRNPDFGLPWWLSSKESAGNAGAEGDWNSIPGSGKYPGRGSNNPLQYSCLENSMDRGASQASCCGVAKSRTLLKWHSSSSRLSQCELQNLSVTSLALLPPSSIPFP